MATGIDPIMLTENFQNAIDQDLEFTVFIKTGPNCRFRPNSCTEITTNSTETIESIKREYQRITGHNIDSQRYIFNKIELHNNETLKHYGIKRNNSISAVIKLPIQREINLNQMNENANLLIPNPINPNSINIDNPLTIIPLRQQNLRSNLDPSTFSFLSCCIAYCTICFILPLIALPDIVTIVVVNNYDFNYDTNTQWNKCLWTSNNEINVAYFINCGATFSILMYLLFSLWIFWCLKIASFIRTREINPRQVQFTGCRRILASTKRMYYIWWSLNFILFAWSITGIVIYDDMISNSCSAASIGTILIVWSIIHILFSFCICCPLSVANIFGWNSDNIFSNM